MAYSARACRATQVSWGPEEGEIRIVKNTGAQQTSKQLCSAPGGRIFLITSYGKKNPPGFAHFSYQGHLWGQSLVPFTLPVQGGGSKQHWKVFLFIRTQTISVRKMETLHSWINWQCIHPSYLFQRQLTWVDENPPSAFLCCESHLTTGRAEATSPRSV